jgi:energy-coupling factor transporter ATP-binding protein EcfA2
MKYVSEIEYLQNPTRVGITSSIGGINILGFNVQINQQSSVWLTLREGLNVIYGKNGSGKSTLLNALRRFCSTSDDHVEGERVDLYFEIDSFSAFGKSLVDLFLFEDLFDYQNREMEGGLLRPNFHLIDRSINGSPLPNEGIPFEAQESPGDFYRTLFGTSVLSLDCLVHKVRERLDVMDEVASGTLKNAVQQWTEDLFSKEGVSTPLDEEMWLRVLAFFLLQLFENESNPLTEAYNHGWPDWYVSYIKHSLASTLFHGEPINLLESKCDWGREWAPSHLDGSPMALDRFHLNGSNFAQLVEHQIDELFCELLSFFTESSKESFTKEFDDAHQIEIESALRSVCSSDVFRLSKSSTSSWSLAAATRSVNLHSALKDPETIEKLKGTWFRAGFEFGQSTNDNLFSFEFVSEYEHWQPTVKHLPFVLIDLDADLDFEKFFLKAAPRSFGLDEIDDDFLSSYQAELDRLSQGISSFFTHLGVAIEQMRVVVSKRAVSWMTKSPISIEYLDGHLRRWVPVNRASSAQQRWMKLAIHLYVASQYRAPVLLVADEPDQGLHISAGQSISRVLRGTGQTSLISSHSPGVIRDPFVHLLHAHRGALGEFQLENLEVSDDPLVSSFSLGIDTVDLLARLRVAVFVEGEHDLAAVDELLRWQEGDSQDPRIRQFTKIIASRGVGQMTNSVDAQLLLDYTDAHLLIIADNFQTERFDSLLKHLQKGQREGLDDRQLFELLRKKHYGSPNPGNKQSGRTFEERTMFDVLKVAIRNRSLDRLTIIGIGAADITELFPSSSFGLKDSWDQLRADFNNDRNLPNVPKSFKDWLRISRNADITARRIALEVRKSCESTEGPPPALVEVGSAIASLATRE